MHISKLRAVGGSVMVSIPKPLLDVLGLKANAAVGLSIDDGRLIVDPGAKPRYTLDELLAASGRKTKPTAEDRAWTNGRRVGREQI